jgi:hypothetical protein
MVDDTGADCTSKHARALCDREMESGMQMLQVEELIRRIEDTETPRPDYEDQVGEEMHRVLDHLRVALDSHVRGRLRPGTADPSSRPDLWYH